MGASSPLRCRRVSYPGHVIVPHWCCLVVVVLACHPRVSWSCHSCAMASSSCVFLTSATVILVLAASSLSHIVGLSSCCVWARWVGMSWGGYSPGCLIITCVRSWVLAIVCVHFQVLFVVWGCTGGHCGSWHGVAMLLLVVLLLVVCRGCRPSMAAVSSRLLGMVVTWGGWWQVSWMVLSWMVVESKKLLLIDDTKSSVGICQHPF